MKEDGTITYRDLYIQVKRMKLKHPHIFLSLALPHLSIYTFKTFRVSIYYVSCFIWHYPSHTFGIIYAAGKVYKDKQIKSIKMWWQRMKTYSPYAQVVTRRYRTSMQRCQSVEALEVENDASALNM